MFEFAKRKFELNRPIPESDETEIQHLEKLLKGELKKARPNERTVLYLRNEMKVPSFPILMRRIWEIFLCLNEERVWDGLAGPRGLRSIDIEAWCRLNRTCLTQFELNTIKGLDRVWLTVRAEHRKQMESSKGK